MHSYVTHYSLSDREFSALSEKLSHTPPTIKHKTLLAVTKKFFENFWKILHNVWFFSRGSDFSWGWGYAHSIENFKLYNISQNEQNLTVDFREKNQILKILPYFWHNFLWWFFLDKRTTGICFWGPYWP